MNIKVRYFGLIRNVVGKDEEEVCAAECSTVRQALEMLIRRHGDGFRDSVLAGRELLRPTAILFLDGQDIKQMGGLDAQVNSDTEISIAVVTHALGGG